VEDAVNANYKADKNNIDNFLERKTPSFSFSSLRRVVLSELSYRGAFKHNRICGFSRQNIMSMAQYPERYGDQIVRLSKYMVTKSGYYKRLVDYFVNMAIINWTVDVEIKNEKMFSVNQKTFRKNFVNFVAQANKFKIDNRISDIMRKLFVEDACFGFINEDAIDCPIYFIDSKYCEIKKIVNGNVYEYAVNRSLITNDYFETLPSDLQSVLTKSKEISLNNLVMIPYENSFCIKYNNDFTYLYPPFLPLILAILDIEDIKELNKAKSEADAYKLIYLKIPTNDESEISMGDELISKFVSMTREILPDRFGVVPSPMDLQLVESKSTISDDKNKVEQSVDNFYGEAGVSKALISSASSGSELKLSMKVDSSDIYRIYRQIEAWVDLQMKIRGYIYDSYQFVYNIMPTTVFDIDDFIDRQLKLAQASVPNKGMLLAANGINTAKMLGNSFMEQVFKEDIFDKWEVLKTSYTTPGGTGTEDGRPEKEETEISDVTEATRKNDGNDKDNRV